MVASNVLEFYDHSDGSMSRTTLGALFVSGIRHDHRLEETTFGAPGLKVAADVRKFGSSEVLLGSCGCPLTNDLCGPRDGRILGYPIHRSMGISGS